VADRILSERFDCRLRLHVNLAQPHVNTPFGVRRAVQGQFFNSSASECEGVSHLQQT